MIFRTVEPIQQMERSFIQAGPCSGSSPAMLSLSLKRASNFRSQKLVYSKLGCVLETSLACSPQLRYQRNDLQDGGALTAQALTGRIATSQDTDGWSVHSLAQEACGASSDGLVAGKLKCHESRFLFGTRKIPKTWCWEGYFIYFGFSGNSSILVLPRG